jgi:uncharacterized protein YndB with AHSA1/START domain
MAGSGKTTVTTPTDTEIRMSRVFDAPRDLVFEAHSSAEHMRNWWGPRNYETISAEVDFRPGGKWRVVQRGPDGDEYAFRGEFREIVPPERITWTFEFEGAPGQISVETVSFEERDGKTTVSVISDLGSKEARDAMLESGMAEGADETYDRLDEYLERLKARAS